MEQLKDLPGLMIRQKTDLAEALIGFEQKNKYAVMTEAGDTVCFAAEEGGNFVLRMLLKGYRPFTIAIVSESGERLLTLKRPFRFFFSRLDIMDAGGVRLGTIEREFALLRRIYKVMDASGTEVFKLFGPILRPWTFQVMRDGGEIGKITKKWSGLLKEAVTKADNFGVTFPPDLDVKQKAILLAGVFLIDFVHFER